MIPNIENILTNYLRNHASITALNARVVQKPPAKKDTPWIEVQKLDDPDVGAAQVEYLINFMVQFDCYASANRVSDGLGGGPPEATTLALTTRAVLKALQDTTEGGARFTAVRFLGGLRIADEALDREIVTATFHCHSVS